MIIKLQAKGTKGTHCSVDRKNSKKKGGSNLMNHVPKTYRFHSMLP